MPNKRKIRTTTKNKKSNYKLVVPILLFFGFSSAKAQMLEIPIVNFQNVSISPHLHVVFKESDKESVVINKSRVDMSIIKVEVENNTLYVYLDGMKDETYFGHEAREIRNEKASKYKGTVADIIINYKKIVNVTVIGDEEILLPDAIVTENFSLKMISNTKVVISKIQVQHFDLVFIGNNNLIIKSGEALNQNISATGENEMNAIEVSSKNSMIKFTGNNFFKLKISDELKLNSTGGSKLFYRGNPNIEKEHILGNPIIEKIKD